MGRKRREGEESMSEDQQRAVDALRILRAAVDEVMIRKGLSDEEDVVGEVITLPQGDLSTPRYEAAVEELLQVGALTRDAETDEANVLVSSVPGAPEAFKFTSGGAQLLRSAREMGM
jgi:hypothetical protein